MLALCDESMCVVASNVSVDEGASTASTVPLPGRSRAPDTASTDGDAYRDVLIEDGYSQYPVLYEGSGSEDVCTPMLCNDDIAGDAALGKFLDSEPLTDAMMIDELVFLHAIARRIPSRIIKSKCRWLSDSQYDHLM